MATAPSINRDWIAAEFSKGIDAEQSLHDDALATAQSPPDPAFGVLYHEIAEADKRHIAAIETIAARYGHVPSQGGSGGVSGALGRLKQKVSEIGSTPLQVIEQDMLAKASAIHWMTAWLGAFEAIGDAESARELASLLTEEKAHHDALQQGFNRLVARGAGATTA
ncbi:hypothetical protein TA3x_001382 [Tundrisphaera sp. TA3]|uniref:hypothetical protein n=1 Tax=Tundrisphaera sp. TA3 TaxID=3435775 RepID=UPI003EBAFF22